MQMPSFLLSLHFVPYFQSTKKSGYLSSPKLFNKRVLNLLTKIWSLSDIMFDFLTKPLRYDHWSKHSCCLFSSSPVYIKIRVQPRWPFQFKNQFFLPNLTLKIKSQPPHTVGPCAVQNPTAFITLMGKSGKAH